MSVFKKEEVTIYYEQHGSGPAILMIAGMASDSKSWQFILDRMTKHFSLIIFDNRGCGRTECISDAYTIKDMAKDAVDLLDQIGLEKVHVIGHSMGGMIAQELALMHPERVDKLVLASSSPKLSQKADDILQDLYEKWKSGYDMADWFRIMFQWLFTKEALENKKFVDAAIIFALAYPYPQSLDGFKGQVNALCSFDVSDRIHKIKQKTLILSGAEDILIPTKESEKLLNIGGTAMLKVIDNAAHSIHAERPGEFADAVVAFLNRK